jgi:dihydropteroate synthase
MGILNVTPDSFSDGGDYYGAEAAIAHGLDMAAQGADIIDVGGESTRPGALRVPGSEQIRRIKPVISGLRRQLPEQVLISVDTTLAEVAGAACAAGAGMINDIAAGEDDTGIMQLAADYGLPLILMHKQGSPATMQRQPEYVNVVEDILAYLLDRAAAAIRSGVKRENLILDPGFGFGKTQQHNLQILASLQRFTGAGFPVLMGASRKSFLAGISREQDRKLLVGASCATTVLGVMAGVTYFRVHDVRQHRQAADIAYATLMEREE